MIKVLRREHRLYLSHQLFNYIRVLRTSTTEVERSVAGDKNVVFDSETDTSQFFGDVSARVRYVDSYRKGKRNMNSVSLGSTKE